MSLEQNTAEVPTPVSGSRPIDQAVDSLAGTICHEHFPPGDLADLRRLQPASPRAPGFWRLLVVRVPAELRRSQEQESHWAAVMQAMAIMAPAAHQPDEPLGTVLADLDQGPMERRLMSLLATRENEAMWDQLRLLARMLASKARPMNFRQVANWLLARDEKQREKVRRDMARAFFFRQYQKASEGQNQT